jgi:hypothetical protein
MSEGRAEQRQKTRARLFAWWPPEPNDPIKTKSHRYAKLSVALPIAFGDCGERLLDMDSLPLFSIA